MKLPPFGKMSGYYYDLALKGPMEDWRPDRPQREREQSFSEWRTGIRDLIADHIWPRFDRDSRLFVGKATEWAEAATAAEIGIMILEFRQEPAYLDRVIASPNAVPNPSTQRYHYEIDDDLEKPVVSNFDEYDRTLSPSELQQFIPIAVRALNKKPSGLFWLKHELVRPRPLQASMILGFERFTSEVARTALHSSCHSGHCLEGLLACCALAETWWSAETPPDQGRLDSLKQYAVDFGDRRVFGGVHYPSDNIVSWVIALDLIPHIFTNADRVLAFALDAIVNHSVVYKVVQDTFPKHSELFGALRLLDQSVSAAGGKATERAAW